MRTVALHPPVGSPEEDLTRARKSSVRVVLKYVVDLAQDSQGEEVAVLYI